MTNVMIVVRPYGAPQGLERAIEGKVVQSTATHVLVALQGQDGEVYRTISKQQVKEMK